MSDAHVFAAQLSEQLHIMVAGDAEGGADVDHIPYQTQAVDDARPAIDQIANEHRLSTIRMSVTELGPAWRRRINCSRLIAELEKQLLQFITASMDIANEIERAMFVPPIVPEGCPLNGDGVYLLGRFQYKYVAKSFTLEGFERTSQLRALLPDNMSAEIAVRSISISPLAHILWQVEDNGDRQGMILAGQRHQGLPRLVLHVRGIDDGKAAGGQPF
jgi:hypothetical protein